MGASQTAKHAPDGINRQILRRLNSQHISVATLEAALRDVIDEYARFELPHYWGKRIELCGPELGRPSVDTLEGSQHGNMKEMRFKHDGGVWRVAFAFDPERNRILLVAGNKRGVDQKKFYKTLIKIADERYTDHLSTLKQRL